MLLKTKGKPHLIEHPIIGRITYDACVNSSDSILIASNEIPLDVSAFTVILTALPREYSIDAPSVYEVPTFDHLSEGDIIIAHSDGTINTLYRINSAHNSLLFTERCNSNCLMCSQPPKNKDDARYLFDVYTRLIPLIPKDCIELGITGGEPTLLGNLFFKLIEQMQVELPTTDLHCLTNGRSFAWPAMAKRLGAIAHTGLMLGIPLYSDHYQQHDYIVQAKHAFHQTMQGIYNLAMNNQRIEIRIVLHKQTIPRLVKLAKYIYKNLPFVEHVAFMGLEYQGYTPYNIGLLGIDPMEYMNELSEATIFLFEQGLNVSIYNSQLCLLPEELWRFNRKSISDWKNDYLPACNGCSKRTECGGFFTWNLLKQSQFIKPFN